MIRYEEIKRLIRFKEKDNNEIRFSDYEIKMAVNECIRYLNNSLALQNSDFLEKVIDLDQEKMNAAIRPSVATVAIYSSANDSAILGRALLGYMIMGSSGTVVPDEPETPDDDTELYDFKLNGVDLPEDFITLCSIQRARDGYIMSPVEAIKVPLDGQYKIMGGRIYSGNTSIKVLYKAAIAEVKESTDGIELPFVFKDVLVKLSCMILNNAETDVMMKAVDDAVRAIVPRRRYTNARIKMPFMV